MYGLRKSLPVTARTSIWYHLPNFPARRGDRWIRVPLPRAKEMLIGAGENSIVFSTKRLEPSSSPSGKLAAYKLRDRWIPVPLPPPYTIEIIRYLDVLFNQPPDQSPIARGLATMRRAHQRASRARSRAKGYASASDYVTSTVPQCLRRASASRFHNAAQGGSLAQTKFSETGCSSSGSSHRSCRLEGLTRP